MPPRPVSRRRAACLESRPVKTIYSENHRLHHTRAELVSGKMVPAFEYPRRAEIVIERIRAVGLGPILEPRALGLEAAKRVHAPRFVDFLEGAWDAWVARQGDETDALAFTWPTRSLRDVEPKTIEGQLGFYSFDAGCGITKGTFTAARSAVEVALTGVALLQEGESSAFSLCRPPGHHAAADQMGGYCYLNNAAIAAQALTDAGRRVAILDVDYHHGNGTQQIFYDRADVLFVSLHGTPETEYPFFLGYADEIGAGAGEGTNLNFPLPFGTLWPAFDEALQTGSRKVKDWGADTLVVSLGLDTYEEDPISKFKLKSEDFLRMGERIAALGLPTLFVFEGGYAVEPLGVNTANVLTGFEGAHKL